MECINCGAENKKELNFCEFCGAPLVLANEESNSKKKKKTNYRGLIVALLFFFPLFLYGIFILFLIILGLMN